MLQNWKRFFMRVNGKSTRSDNTKASAYYAWDCLKQILRLFSKGADFKQLSMAESDRIKFKLQ